MTNVGEEGVVLYDTTNVAEEVVVLYDMMIAGEEEGVVLRCGSGVVREAEEERAKEEEQRVDAEVFPKWCN